jgi:hypothetical protein
MVISRRNARCTCRAKSWHDPTAHTHFLTAVRYHGRTGDPSTAESRDVILGLYFVI